MIERFAEYRRIIMSNLVYRLRMRLAKLLIGRNAYVANITLISTLAIDIDASPNGVYYNVSVRMGHDEKIPDTAFYFAASVKYKDETVTIAARQKKH